MKKIIETSQFQDILNIYFQTWFTLLIEYFQTFNNINNNKKNKKKKNKNKISSLIL